MSVDTTPRIAELLAFFMRAFFYGMEGTFLYGMEMLAEILKGMQRIAQQSLDAAARDGLAQPASVSPFPPSGGPWTQFGQPVAAEPLGGDFADKPVKEVREMNVDQDLSGDQVKVVQYFIATAVTDEAGTGKVLIGPEQIAFSDDMSGEDFVAWIMAKNADKIPKKKYRRKFLRVAYQVVGRFAEADFHYDKKKVAQLHKIAHNLEPPLKVKPVEGRPVKVKQPVRVIMEPERSEEVKPEEVKPVESTGTS